MSSPPEFITPPGSERSLSGEGKETLNEQAPEQTQKVTEQGHFRSNFRFQALEFAMNDVYRQKFSCEICHKTFTRKYSLSRHYKEVHQGESRSSKFQCKSVFQVNVCSLYTVSRVVSLSICSPWSKFTGNQ